MCTFVNVYIGLCSKFFNSFKRMFPTYAGKHYHMNIITFIFKILHLMLFINFIKNSVNMNYTKEKVLSGIFSFIPHFYIFY